MKSDISVIVCTWNNCGRLRQTLKRFAEVRIPKCASWELIVVDNNSKDATKSVVDEAARTLPIRYVYESVQGLSYARNRGIASISGDLVIFTDDDVTPCPHWMCEYWSAFQRMPKGYFWGGPIASEFEHPNVDAELVALGPASIKGLDWGATERLLNWPREYCVAANWACSREALKSIGKFDTRLGLNPVSKRVETGEETEMMQRLVSTGWKLWYLPAAKLGHFVPAKKATIQHIAERNRAHSRYKMRELIQKEQMPGSVRPWMYKKRIGLRLRWISAKIQGKKGYKEYLTLYEFLGQLDAYKERRKQKRTKSAIASTTL